MLICRIIVVTKYIDILMKILIVHMCDIGFPQTFQNVQDLLSLKVLLEFFEYFTLLIIDLQRLSCHYFVLLQLPFSHSTKSIGKKEYFFKSWVKKMMVGCTCPYKCSVGLGLFVHFHNGSMNRNTKHTHTKTFFWGLWVVWNTSQASK